MKGIGKAVAATFVAVTLAGGLAGSAQAAHVSPEYFADGSYLGGTELIGHRHTLTQVGMRNLATAETLCLGAKRDDDSIAGGNCPTLAEQQVYAQYYSNTWLGGWTSNLYFASYRANGQF